jgi:hypothetical protein
MAPFDNFSFELDNTSPNEGLSVSHDGEKVFDMINGKRPSKATRYNDWHVVKTFFIDQASEQEIVSK